MALERVGLSPQTDMVATVTIPLSVAGINTSVFVFSNKHIMFLSMIGIAVRQSWVAARGFWAACQL